MSTNTKVFTDAERRAIAVKAVNRLIADAEAKRLLENKELAEVISVCIQRAPSANLEDLRWLMERQEQERPDLEKPREYIN